MSPSPPKFMCWDLILSGTAFGGGSLGVSRSAGWSPHKWNECPYKWAPERAPVLPTRGGTVRRPPSANSAGASTLGSPVSGTARNSVRRFGHVVRGTSCSSPTRPRSRRTVLNLLFVTQYMTTIFSRRWIIFPLHVRHSHLGLQSILLMDSKEPNSYCQPFPLDHIFVFMISVAVTNVSCGRALV